VSLAASVTSYTSMRPSAANATEESARGRGARMNALSMRTIALSTSPYLYVCANESYRVITRESSESRRCARNRFASKPSTGKPVADVSRTTASTIVSLSGAASGGQRSGQELPDSSFSPHAASETVARAMAKIEKRLIRTKKLRFIAAAVIAA
jgi:hypothetical protein